LISESALTSEDKIYSITQGLGKKTVLQVAHPIIYYYIGGNYVRSCN
jgi:hypothetical protein